MTHASLKNTIVFRGHHLLRVSDAKGPPPTHALADRKISYVLSDHAARRLGHVAATKTRNRALHLGAGIYGCYLDGRLFYVGIFAGAGTPDKGNVINERWRKHVGGMTLRGEKVTLCESGLETIAREGLDSELARAILAARPRMSKDRGLQTNINKFRFADRHWRRFRGLDDRLLERFQFSYVRFADGGVLAGVGKEVVKHHLAAVEKAIVRTLRPPCNKDSGKTDGETRHGLPHTVRLTRKLLAGRLEAIAAGTVPLMPEKKPKQVAKTKAAPVAPAVRLAA